MTFRLSSKSKIFITTESPTGAVALGTGVSAVADNTLGASDGIGSQTAIRALGDVVSHTNTRSQFSNVIGIDIPAPSHIRDELDIYNGLKSTVKVQIGSEASVTLLMVKKSNAMLKLFTEAPYGLGDDDEIYDGTTIISNHPTVGYRIYEFDGTSWNVYYHCLLMPGAYSCDPSDHDAAVRETLVFSCNDFRMGVPVGEIAAERPLK